MPAAGDFMTGSTLKIGNTITINRRADGTLVCGWSTDLEDASTSSLEHLHGFSVITSCTVQRAAD